MLKQRLSLHKKLALSALIAGCFAAISPQTAHAATYYWDNNGATSLFGTAAGTWAAPTTNSATQGWSIDSTGATLPTGTTTVATSDAENFGSATANSLLAGTITVSGTVAAGNITFGAGAGAIVLSGGTINMGASSITVNNASDTIGSVLGGTNALTKAGTGTLVLTGVSTRTGALTISAGKIQFSGAGSMGTSANFAGTIANSGTLQYSSSAAQTLSGIISGTGAIIKDTSTSTLILSAVNTYTGATTISAGTLNLTGNRTAVMGGTVDVLGGGSVLNISGNLPMGAQQLRVGSGTTTTGTINQTAGAVTFTSGNQLTVGTTSTSQGIYNLSGGSFTTASQANRGVIVGTNASTNGVFNLSAGTLNVVSGSSLQIGRSETAAAAIGASGTFAQTGGTATISELRMGGLDATTNASQTAILNISAGTFSASSFTSLSGGNSSNSTINISGTADVTLPAFPTTRGAGATATITFDGGTLRPFAADSAYMGGLTNAFIKAGGARFDTTNGNITVTQALLTDGVSLGGGLTKQGTNSLAIAGANTFTGATTVNAGTLKLDYSTQDNSKLSDTTALILSGGTLDLSGGTHSETVASTSLTTLTASNVTRSSGAATINLNTITNGVGSTINFGASNIATTDNLNNASGILGFWATVGGTDWAANSTNAADGLIIAYAGNIDVQRLTPGTIADGSATNVRLVEGSGSAGNITLGAATTTINSLIQSTTGGSSAATIDPASQTLATNAILVGTGAGALTIGTGVNNGILTTATAGGDLTLINNAANGFTINSVIADNTSASTLTKYGTGTATLAGANTYTGATTIYAGTLQLSGGTNRLPTATSVNLANVTGAILDVNGQAQTIAGLAGGGTSGGNVTLGAGALTVSNSSPNTYDGVISGATGTLTMSGSSTLTLSGANSYGGGTTVSAGTLQATINAATSVNALGTGAVSVGPGSTLVLNDTKTTNITDNINNTFTGAGLLKLQFAANTTARNTQMPNVTGFTGTIQLSALGLTGDKWNAAGLGTISGSLIVDSGTTIIVGSGNTTFTGGITLNGVGNNEGRGAIRVGGATTIVGGNINLASSSTISMENVGATIPGNISSGAVGTQVLTLGGTAGSVGGTLSGVIGGGAGALDLSVAGTAAGVYTLTNTNTYTGATTIAASTTLQLGNGLTGNDGTINGSSGISNSGTLTYNVFGTVSSGVPISGTGAVTKSGAGTQTLSANNSYSGVTTVNAGTLILSGDNSATTGATNINGGTLVAAHVGALNTTGLVNISTATGSGTLRLATDSSVNAYQIAGSSSNPGTIISDRATPGAGITHVLGAMFLGANTYSFQAGSNVTSGTAAVSLASLNLSSGSAGTATLNPTTADVLIPGAVNIGANTNPKTLALSGTSTGNQISGVISNNLNTLSLTKSGTSTWNLSGANTYTGPTTVNAGTLVISGSPTGNSATNVNGGTLTLDYTTNDTDKINDLSILTFGGGTLNLNSVTGTHVEVVASTTLTAGTISLITRSAGTNVIALNTITPNAGAILNFGANNIATTDNTNLLGGTLLGSWATVGGIDWAVNSTNAADGLITAYSAYTDVQRLTPGTIADGVATNVRLVEGGGVAGSILLGSATTTINTLNQSASGGSSAATIDPAGQILATNAILVGTGAGSLTIGTGVNNGTLMTATVGGDLSLTNNTANGLTINSVIANNTSASTLSKLGTGPTILTGVNTYTGATTIGAGGLTISGAGQLGGGTYPGAISTAAGSTLAYSSSADQILSGAISGAASLIKDTSSTSNLSLAAGNTYTGNTTVNAGTLTLAGATGVGTAGGYLYNGLTGTATVTVASGAQIVISSNNAAHNALGFGAGQSWVVGGTINSTGGDAHTLPGNVILNNGTLTGVANATFGTFLTNASYNATITANGNSNAISSGNFGMANALVLATPLVTDALTVSAPLGLSAQAGTLTKNGLGTVTLSGANLYTGATTVSAGTLILSGNRTVQATGGFNVGNVTGSTGTLNVTNGTFTAGTAGSTFLVGNGTGSTGIMNQSGGSLTTIGNQLLIGNSTATGTYNLSGGTLTTIAGSLGVTIGVNTGTTGTFNLSGSGVLAMPATSTLQITRSDNSAASGVTGTFAQTGGTATVGILQMGGSNTTPANGANNNATLNLSGGIFAATTFNVLSGANTSISTINISGMADVTLPAFPTARGTGATATINFDGGTLKNAAASATYMGGLTNAFIKAGGARFDTTAGDITITQALLTDGVSLGGGLTKQGTNVLTLSGANTYTGVTNVAAGTLRLTNAAALGGTANGTVVAAGATLDSNSTLTVTGEALSLSGTGALVGALHVGGSQALTWDGPITLAANALAKADGGASFVTTTAGTVNLGANALTVRLDGSTASTFNGVISGVGGSLIKESSSTLVLTGANTYTGGTTVTTGTLQVGTGGTVGTGAVTNNASFDVARAGLTTAAISGTGSTTVTAVGASLTANSVRQAGLSIGAGNTVTVAPNGGNTGVSVLSTLSIPGGATPTGTLDLKNNDMVLNNASQAAGLASLASVTSQVGYAFDNFAWDRAGITSTTVAADVAGGTPTALGILFNNDGGGSALFYGDGSPMGLPQFSGQTVDQNALLVKYTWLGDADLNGVVDSVDFSLFQAGFGMAAPYSGWAFGDFDYNGTVDSVDFGLFQAGFGGQTGTLLTSGSPNISAVPEPSTWVLGGLAMLGLAGLQLRRRRLAV